MKRASKRLINITYTTRLGRDEKTRGFIRPLCGKTPTSEGACRMIVKAIKDEDPNARINTLDVFVTRVETMIYQP
jgi:hypothetical protein